MNLIILWQSPPEKRKTSPFEWYGEQYLK